MQATSRGSGEPDYTYLRRNKTVKWLCWPKVHTRRKEQKERKKKKREEGEQPEERKIRRRREQGEVVAKRRGRRNFLFSCWLAGGAAWG